VLTASGAASEALATPHHFSKGRGEVSEKESLKGYSGSRQVELALGRPMGQWVGSSNPTALIARLVLRSPWWPWRCSAIDELTIIFGSSILREHLSKSVGELCLSIAFSFCSRRRRVGWWRSLNLRRCVWGPRLPWLPTCDAVLNSFAQVGSGRVYEVKYIRSADVASHCGNLSFVALSWGVGFRSW